MLSTKVIIWHKTKQERTDGVSAMESYESNRLTADFIRIPVQEFAKCDISEGPRGSTVLTLPSGDCYYSLFWHMMILSRFNRSVVGEELKSELSGEK